MTAAEVVKDIAAVLDKVRQGDEIVVEQDHRPVAVIKTPPGPGRMISECIAIAKQREKERGYPVTLDPDFAADVEEIVRNRQPWNPPSWD
jgi:antitoxin (DNA-binding transcriptional repressor) of toxin-antitoxin stability system